MITAFKIDISFFCELHENVGPVEMREIEEEFGGIKYYRCSHQERITDQETKELIEVVDCKNLISIMVQSV